MHLETIRLIVLGLFVALLGGAVVVVLEPFVVSMLWAGILAFASWSLYIRLLHLARGRAWLTACQEDDARGFLQQFDPGKFRAVADPRPTSRATASSPPSLFPARDPSST